MDQLSGRRKRGAPRKQAPEMPMHPEMMIRPGTRAFGQRAAARKENIQKRKRAGDLRVQTGYKTVKASTYQKRKMMMED